MIESFKDIIKLKSNGIATKSSQNRLIEVAFERIEETNDFFGINKFLDKATVTDLPIQESWSDLLKRLIHKTVNKFKERYGSTPYRAPISAQIQVPWY